MTLPWKVMRYDGATWQNCDLKRWNGSSWVNADAYYWDGADWVLMTDRTPPTSTHTTTYGLSSFMNYRNNNSERTGSSDAYQGYYDSLYGLQKSMLFYAYATIDAALSGYTAIYYNKLQMNNAHWYYGAGGTAVICTHNVASNTGTFSYSTYNFASQAFTSRGQNILKTLPTSLAVGFVAGTIKGLGLYSTSTSETYYGYFETTGSGFDLTISFEK